MLLLQPGAQAIVCIEFIGVCMSVFVVSCFRCCFVWSPSCVQRQITFSPCGGFPESIRECPPPLKTEESLPYKSNNHMGSNEENIPPCFGGMLGVCFLQYELHEHTPVAWGMLSSWNPYDLSVLRVCALHLVCRKGAILLF